MPYAIMRFEKRKGGPASAIEKHHERKKPRYASNPDVDTDRSHLNYHLVEPRHKYYAEIQSRIEQAQRKNPKLKVRRDSVKFIDTIVTATPDYLTQLPPEQVRRYFERALEFFSREVGAENIFSAVVHMDERNPHMHLCFVPLTKDHRLSAKEVIGGRDKLVEWQDKFHDHMAAEFPELERGQSAAVTRRKHIPTWLYKQSHRLTQEMVEIRAELEQTGTLNAKKQREKILKLLDKWYPQINAFEAKLKPYDEQLQRMRDELIRSRSTMLRALDAQEESQQQNLELMDELPDFLLSRPSHRNRSILQALDPAVRQSYDPAIGTAIQTGPVEVQPPHGTVNRVAAGHTTAEKGRGMDGAVPEMRVCQCGIRE